MGVDSQIRCRSQVALWAYAYEVMDDPIVADDTYDAKCLEVNPEIKTGRLDDFFANEFSPDTGMWIYKHPEINKIARLYERVTGMEAVYTDVKPEPKSLVAQGNSTPFKTRLDGMIYLASLGFNVVPSALIGGEFGRLDFEYDKDFFIVTQHHTGISKVVFYKDYFSKKYEEQP